MRTSLFLILLTTIACTDKGSSSGDDTGSVIIEDPEDLDNDGYTVEDGDCDDEDATRNPSAVEVCDEQDNDCDGETDEFAVDAETFYADADNDGYGDEGSTYESCAAPSGYVDDDSDCNDGDAAIYPGAEELDCSDPTDYNCDGSVGYADGDSDGYPACEECDDANADVNPDADEYCDDVDNDCDGVIDNDEALDASEWYIDYDGDGYGSSNETFNKVACDQPEGYVDNSSDCNDYSSTAYPGADETCDNELDDDCDGVVNEPDAVDAETWYADSDGDGYGNPFVQQIACEQPSNYVSDDSDCDDTDDEINPELIWYSDGDGDGYGISGGATTSCEQPSGYASVSGDCDDTDDEINPSSEEVCDSEDNDCDGVVDNDDADDAALWYADADGDEYGDPDNTTTACNQPTGYENNADDCDDSSDAINPDAEENCNDGVDDNCDGESDDCTLDLLMADAAFEGPATNDNLGYGGAYVGDMNGDGYGDLVIGARQNDDADTDAGASFVLYGPITDGTLNISDAADYVLSGESSGDKSGAAVSGDGDVNNDGYDDVLIGANAKSSERGYTYLIHGPVTSDMSLDQADAYFYGANNYDRSGLVLTMAGDVNGDDYDDILIVATSYDYDPGSGKLNDSGGVFLFYGPASGDYSLDDADAFRGGEAESDKAGEYVSRAGDLNDDGYEDLLIGSRQEDTNGTSSGAAYIQYGPVSGSDSIAIADVKIVGVNASDQFGYSLASAGDMNGDGYDDFLVGANTLSDTLSAQGAAYLFYGPASSLATGTSADADVVIAGNEGEQLGTRVAGGEDFDGDGELDVLISASNAGSLSEGAVYLIYGALSGSYDIDEVASAAMVGDESNDNVGNRVISFTGDVDGSGTPSILIGAPSDDESGTDAGAFYLINDIGL